MPRKADRCARANAIMMISGLSAVSLLSKSMLTASYTALDVPSVVVINHGAGYSKSRSVKG